MHATVIVKYANSDARIAAALSAAATREEAPDAARICATDRSPVPFPIPRRKVKGTVSAKTMDEIQSAQFGAKAVEPHNTRSGFLFFDVQGIRSLAGTHILFTNLHNGEGGDLMFFEIPLDKYFGGAAGASSQ